MCTGKFEAVLGQAVVRSWLASGEVAVGSCADLFKPLCTPAWNVTCLGPTTQAEADLRVSLCQSACDGIKGVCEHGCDECSGDCQCACAELSLACSAGCNATARACETSNQAVGGCAVARASGNPSDLAACCASERSGCGTLCKLALQQCRSACWRSYTYQWTPPGLGDTCVRTCGTGQVWKANGIFKRERVGTVASAIQVADARLEVLGLASELTEGALLMVDDEILNVSSFASCPGDTYPCDGALVEVARAAGNSSVGRHAAGQPVEVLPCRWLVGPQPMCGLIHDTLCAAGGWSWKACPAT